MRKAMPGPHPLLDVIDAAGIETVAPVGPEEIRQFIERMADHE